MREVARKGVMRKSCGKDGEGNIREVVRERCGRWRVKGGVVKER